MVFEPSSLVSSVIASAWGFASVVSGPILMFLLWRSYRKGYDLSDACEEADNISRDFVFSVIAAGLVGAVTGVEFPKYLLGELLGVLLFGFLFYRY